MKCKIWNISFDIKHRNGKYPFFQLIWRHKRREHESIKSSMQISVIWKQYLCDKVQQTNKPKIHIEELEKFLPFFFFRKLIDNLWDDQNDQICLIFQYLNNLCILFSTTSNYLNYRVVWSGEIQLEACTRTILYHSHAWRNEACGFMKAQHWGCSWWSNKKIIPPIWWCDPDTCEPEWDRVKYFITYHIYF